MKSAACMGGFDSSRERLTFEVRCRNAGLAQRIPIFSQVSVGSCEVKKSRQAASIVKAGSGAAWEHLPGWTAPVCVSALWTRCTRL